MKNIKVRNRIVILSSFQNCINNKKFQALFEAFKLISDMWNVKFDITLINFHEHRTGPDACLNYYMEQHKDYYNPRDRLKFEILDGNIECHQDVCLLYNHLINSNDYDLIIDCDSNDLIEINLLRSMFIIDKVDDYVKMDTEEVTLDKIINFLFVTLTGGCK